MVPDDVRRIEFRREYRILAIYNNIILYNTLIISRCKFVDIECVWALSGSIYKKKRYVGTIRELIDTID